jgi:hypothetical protein
MLRAGCWSQSRIDALRLRATAVLVANSKASSPEGVRTDWGREAGVDASAFNRSSGLHRCIGGPESLPDLAGARAGY